MTHKKLQLTRRIKIALIINLVLTVVALVGCGPEDPSKTPTENKCNGSALDSGEKCDGTHLNNKTCADFTNASGQSYNGGTLACSSNCASFDTSNCTYTPPSTCNGTAKEPNEKCDGTHLDNKTCADFTNASGQSYNGGTLACASDCASFDTSNCTYTPSTTCTDNTFFGQTNASKKRGGGTAELGTYTDTTGIEQTQTAFTELGATGNHSKPIDPAINVNDITVTSTEIGGGYFYVQDQSGAYFVRIPKYSGTAPKTGDKISFKIKEVTSYYGAPQISKIEDLTVTSSNNPVKYIKYSKEIGSNHENFFKIVRFQGNVLTLTQDNKKYNMGELSGENGIKIKYRTKGSINVGDCVTYFGPLSFYKGQPQLNIANFDWYTH